jgi:hypothetical protein
MIDQFLDFLNQNPDLKEELHLFEEVNLPEEHVVFQEKKKLLKSAIDENLRLENTLIAYIEGDLDSTENKLFETYLASHPELKKEHDLFAKTRLIPDPKIIFQGKRKLYRKSGTTIVMNWVARAAAVLVLIWGINSVIKVQNIPESPKANSEMAQISSKTNSNLEAKKPDSQNLIRKSSIPVINKPAKAKVIHVQPKVEPKEIQPVDSNPTNRDLSTLAQISPILPQLDQGTQEAQLAFAHSVNSMKINDSKNVMSVEAFLADRAKKIGKEGLFSAQRIARLGLNLASEISGERIGYKMKDGKIASVGFESKLMAFSIPLEKK